MFYLITIKRGRHVNSRPFHFNVWQIKIHYKLKKKEKKKQLRAMYFSKMTVIKMVKTFQTQPE